MVPDYRLRLFLSVDISGSTAFKYGSGRDGASDESAPFHSRPKWLVETIKFYSGFDNILKRRIMATFKGAEQEQLASPKVWKAVGDEIIYVVTVVSVEHVAYVVTAFLETLFEYRERLVGTYPLDVKAAGWLAAFPAANVTVDLSDFDEDVILNSKSEDNADKRPINFDFLGAAIDCGFRVAKHSTPELMPLTLELAAVLAEASVRSKFSPSLLYRQREGLRGVLRDRPYPVIYVDTERRQSRRLANAREALLLGKQQPQPEAIRDFVFAFMEDEELELPFFEGDEQFKEPSSAYENYKKLNEGRLKEISDEDETQKKSQLEPDQNESCEATSLPESVTKKLGLSEEEF